MSSYRSVYLYLVALLAAVSIVGCHKGILPVSELEEIPRITKEELKAKSENPSVSVIDVRYKPNWEKSDRLIAGAVREEPMEVSSWSHKYHKDKMIVLYCD